MGKYIGTDITYGLFEKQILPVPNPPIYDYFLNHLVSSATSIQVVCERAVLEPNIDYTVTTENGRSILHLHNVDLTNTGSDDRLSLYVVFLGQKLLVPGPDTNDLENAIQQAIQNKADTSYVDSAISNLIDSAPETLNTLNEIANALNNDENFAGWITTEISEINSNIASIESNVSTIETNISSIEQELDTKANSADLATVATSGSYNDLSDKPTLESLAGLLNDLSDVSIDSATKGQFLVHDGTSFVNTRIIEADATTTPLTIKGAVSQTASVVEIKSNSGTTYFSANIDEDYANTPGGDTSFFIKSSNGNRRALVVQGSTNAPNYNVLEVQNGAGLAQVWVDAHYNLNAPQLNFTGGIKLYANGAIGPNGLTSDAGGYRYSLGNNIAVNNDVLLWAATHDSQAAMVALVLQQRNAAPSGNIFECRNSNSEVIFSIDATGVVSDGSVPVSIVSGLATVATSGSYNDLTNTPTIPTTLNGLSDVSVATPSPGQVLKYDGFGWVNSNINQFSGDYDDLTNKPTIPSTLEDLSDVTITTPSPGQVLKYDGFGWYNSADSEFSGNYNDLTNKPTIPSTLAALTGDVTITSPSNTQVLQYNGSKWINAAAPSSGATNLDGLSDVVITSATKGHFLAHNGSSFVNTRTIEADAASTTPLIVKAAASQTANLLQVQNSSGTSLLSVDSSGNLGIGTTTPTNAIHVYKSSGSVDTKVQSDSLSNTQSVALRAECGDIQGRIFVYKHSGITGPCAVLGLDRVTNGSQYIWSDDSGILRISNTLAHVGTDDNGTVVGTQTSDARIKIVSDDEFPYGLNEVLLIDPVEFKLKSDTKQTSRIGFIAQQVQPIVPQSVYDTKEHVDGEVENSPTKLAMDYTSLIPVLVKAIQELNSELNTLKSEKNTLEARLAALEEQQ